MWSGDIGPRHFSIDLDKYMNYYIRHKVLRLDPNADSVHCLFGSDGSSLGNGSVINSFCMVEKDEDLSQRRGFVKNLAGFIAKETKLNVNHFLGDCFR